MLGPVAVALEIIFIYIFWNPSLVLELPVDLALRVFNEIALRYRTGLLSIYH